MHFRVLPFFLLLIGLTSLDCGANDSLYDKKTAQKLDFSKLSIFGPQSSKFRYDKRMLRAAEIAQERARTHSVSRCWRYVKNALLASNTIDTYPKTANAKEAGGELQKSYGFKKINVKDPYRAPLGSVLVYGGRGAGHVEIRTKYGFVSDFRSFKPSIRPLIGVYIKPRA
ncbi:MAG: hypothetical protein JWL90_2747 [Chthoniobacteraceae bacterium]|nr:hypothetical protein [Chthoniobacteraceae bacterium]